MQYTAKTFMVLSVLATTSALAATEQERIKALEEKVEILADALEQNSTSNEETGRVHIGGYGELHYNLLDQNGEDIRQLDFHRMVLFFSYDFNDRARFVTEFEIEHIIASAGNRGAVELEQVYVEMDLTPNMHLQTGVMLMPIGIINETHEPPTFYGVERPIVETTIIPSTWWSAGIGFTHKLESGIRYDLMLTEGLKTDDPNSSLAAEPFNLKKGKQKSSFAEAFDLAVTARVKYTGRPGLELAAYAQFQPDLDQSAKESYADSATLFGGHVIYQFGDLTTKALYARWDLAGDPAKAAGKDLQDGGYLELNYRPTEKWGVFARQSAWSQAADEDKTQTDVGLNFFPFEGVVFKADYQLQNDDAGNSDGFNLGFGYQF